MSSRTALPVPVLLSLLTALSLTIVPLPGSLAYARPEWVLMVLVYWGMAFPRRIGIATAFLSGLFLDVLQNHVLGQNALTLAAAMFIVLQIHPRMRVYPVWQQSVVVAFLVAFVLVLNIWILGTTGYPPESALYWLPILTSAVFWPPIYHLLRDTRRRWLLHLT